MYGKKEDEFSYRSQKKKLRGAVEVAGIGVGWIDCLIILGRMGGP
jgi:hypothetical protein